MMDILVLTGHAGPHAHPHDSVATAASDGWLLTAIIAIALAIAVAELLAAVARHR